MVTKKELFQRGGVVEPGSTHERQLLHLICSNCDIGVQSHTEGVGKIFPVDDTGIGINEPSSQCALNGSGGIVRQLERIPRIVIARTGSNDAQRHSSLAGKNAIDSFVDRAIAPHDDYRTPFLSSTSGEFFRFSPLRRFHILCMFALGATTHYCTMFAHIATIGSRIEDYKRTTRGRRCLHSASPYVGQENLH